MILSLRLAGVLGAATCGLITPAFAQSMPSAAVEGMTDEVRRGLSWSEGRAALAADVGLSLGGLDAGARVVTIRGSDRHGGADAVADLRVGTGWDLGPLRFQVEGIGHLFTGARGGMDYVEAGASASYSYGPLLATLGVIVAPSQHAIGGSNLYTYASANAGIPGTPFTILAEAGHSSGSVDDSIRAQRLRPGGDYWNWTLGVEHRRGPLSIGVHYIGTDISKAGQFGPFADQRHATDRLVGRARVEF